MIQDIVSKEVYKKDGQEKVSWNKVGVLIESNGKKYIKLFHLPNVLFSVFERKEKDQGQAVKPQLTVDDIDIKWADEQ